MKTGRKGKLHEAYCILCISDRDVKGKLISSLDSYTNFRGHVESLHRDEQVIKAWKFADKDLLSLLFVMNCCLRLVYTEFANAKQNRIPKVAGQKSFECSGFSLTTDSHYPNDHPKQVRLSNDVAATAVQTTILVGALSHSSFYNLVQLRVSFVLK